jgi:ADP-ribose pyrophosphatase YjhB (NUDIX family)
MLFATLDRFCPRCGGDLQWRAVNAHDPERQVCVNCRHVHYHNAKPCSEIVAVHDQRVLLVRRAQEPAASKWDLPGGFLEPREHPEDGARREMAEETGLHVALDALLGVYLDTYDDPQGGYAVLVISYLAHVTAGELLLAADEVSEHCWFPLDDLPSDPAFPHMAQTFRDLRARLAARE